MRHRPDVVDRLGSLAELLQTRKKKHLTRKRKVPTAIKQVKVWRKSHPRVDYSEDMSAKFSVQIEYYRRFLKRLFFRRWMRQKVENTADFIEQVVQERVESLMKDNSKPKPTRRSQMRALERLAKPRPNRTEPVTTEQRDKAARRRRIVKRADREIEREQKKPALKRRKKVNEPHDPKVLATVKRLLEPRPIPSPPAQWSPKKATREEIDESISWLLSTRSFGEGSQDEQYHGIRMTREEQNKSIERLTGEPLKTAPRKEQPVTVVQRKPHKPVRERRSEILKRMRQRLLGPVRGPLAVNLRQNMDDEICISVGDLGLETAQMESNTPTQSVIAEKIDDEYEEEEEEEDIEPEKEPNEQAEVAKVATDESQDTEDDEKFSFLLSQQVHDAIGEEEDQTEIAGVSMDSDTTEE